MIVNLVRQGRPRVSGGGSGVIPDASIHNDGMVHDFAIESLDLNTGPIEEDAVATATFTAPESGAEFVCTYHSDMTGRIEIN